MIVSGHIRIPRGPSARTAKVVRTRLLDVSRADAPARIIVEKRLVDVEIPGGSGIEAIAFSLPDAECVDERADLTVSVHVDWNGSGEIEKGDLVTTQTYPVDTARDWQEVQIELAQV